jgi:hypothetical protein
VEGSYRVLGLSYEATWFAHQLNILYFPLWMAATYVGYSAFKVRILRLSVENLLLVFGIVLFFFSSPRVGMIAFLLMVMFIFVKINLRLYRRLFERITGSRLLTKAENKNTRTVAWITGLVSALMLLMIYVGLIALVLYLGSQRDWRMALLLSKPPNWEEISGVLRLDDRVVVWMGYRFAFLERTVYWVTGWRIFNQYPFFGVGLGNAGFFFPLEVPSLGWSSPEIRDMLLRLSYLPNIKSLWVRLLAETGLVGFSTFLGWLYVLWRSAADDAQPTVGIQGNFLAGQLSLIAFIAEVSASILCHALPVVMAGLISAGGMVYRRSAMTEMTASPVNEELRTTDLLNSAEAVGD